MAARLDDDDTGAADNAVHMTPAQVRKLARLTRLHANEAVLKIEQWDERESDYVHVEWLDEYGCRVPGRGGGLLAGYAAVIRENGWSNPSVARMTEELASESPEHRRARGQEPIRPAKARPISHLTSTRNEGP